MIFKNTLNDVVISTEQLVYGFTYDGKYGFQILNRKGIPEFLQTINHKENEVRSSSKKRI